VVALRRLYSVRIGEGFLWQRDSHRACFPHESSMKIIDAWQCIQALDGSMGPR